MRLSGFSPGQSNVEYAAVVVGFLALVLALGVLWRFFDAGAVLNHALHSASHHLDNVVSGAWLDVFIY